MKIGDYVRLDRCQGINKIDEEDEDGDSIFDSMCTDFSNINEEVEVIKEDKKIDYIYHCCMEPSSGETKFLIQNINDLADKINEIIEILNEQDIQRH